MIDFESKKEEIKKFAEEYDLSLVVLFGSQATGKIHSKSDIDIAVLGIENINIFEISAYFDNLFKKGDTEVVNLDMASPTLMYCVTRDGKALYERDNNTFLSWKLYAIKIWQETAWLRRLRDKKLIEWARLA